MQLSPRQSNPGQEDMDSDGLGDAYDNDGDNDTILDATDNLDVTIMKRFVPSSCSDYRKEVELCTVFIQHTGT